MFKTLDASVSLAYILLIASTILCVVYGILFWKKGGNVSQEEAGEEEVWDKEEKEIEDELGGKP